MLGMKNHFDISGSIEIREVDIAGVACIAIISLISNQRITKVLIRLCGCRGSSVLLLVLFLDY